MKYRRCCTISLPGLVKQLTFKYNNSERVKRELAEYGIFLENSTSFICLDESSPFFKNTTRRLI